MSSPRTSAASIRAEALATRADSLYCDLVNKYGYGAPGLQDAWGDVLQAYGAQWALAARNLPHLSRRSLLSDAAGAVKRLEARRVSGK